MKRKRAKDIVVGDKIKINNFKWPVSTVTDCEYTSAGNMNVEFDNWWTDKYRGETWVEVVE